MVRMGRYKLVYDMLGNGELYDLEKDPSEMRNLYGSRKYGKIKRLTQKVSFCFFMRGEKFRRITTEN